MTPGEHAFVRDKHYEAKRHALQSEFAARCSYLVLSILRKLSKNAKFRNVNIVRRKHSLALILNATNP